MEKNFYTLCTNNKYPKYYPKMLARSLKPYGWTLTCLVDSPVKNYDKEENLNFIDVKLFIPEGMQFTFSGWWYKLLLFNNKIFPKKTLFIDVDSIFLRSPDEIDKYIETQPHHVLLAPKDWIHNTIATPLMYIDHSHDMIQCVWDWFYSQRVHPGQKFRGDQDFIDDALNDFYGDLKKAVWGIWPIHFIGSYKCMYDSSWSKFRGAEEQKGIPINKFIAVTFNGKPLIEDIVRRKKKGWEVFERFILDE